MKTIAAAFDTEEQAREAFRRLQDAGVSGDDIGIVLRDQTGQQQRRDEFVRDADEWLGSTVGATIGGVGGWVAGASIASAALAVPVVGPVLAIGALAGIVSAAGGTLGWLAGGLVARGMDQPEANYYERIVEEGRVLMTVKAEEPNLERIRSLLRDSNGREYRAD